jgi:preprotein translocase subunit SecE
MKLSLSTSCDKTIEIHRQLFFVSGIGGEATVGKKNEAEMTETNSGFSIANFLNGTKEEFDKVVWPSRKQLVSESAGVLLMMALSASFIFLVDKFFTWAAKQVF